MRIRIFISCSLFVLCLLMLFPPLARAVPVEPSTGWVLKDPNTGRMIIDYSSAKYKTAFTPAKTRSAYEPPSRAGNRPDVRKLLSTAKSHLGKPYVYGAEGPNSFDCSGFTLYVFKKVGINLPHLASAQAKYGTRVSKSELRPGDLVFFSYYGTSTIEHVGIYVGEGEFIHASTNNGIVITPLTMDYYIKNYIGASRIIPA